MTRLVKGSLSIFALFLFMGMFAACSSSEEDSSGGQSCAEQCPEGQNQDECIIACEA